MILVKLVKLFVFDSGVFELLFLRLDSGLVLLLTSVELLSGQIDLVLQLE